MLYFFLRAKHLSIESGLLPHQLTMVIPVEPRAMNMTSSWRLNPVSTVREREKGSGVSGEAKESLRQSRLGTHRPLR